VLHVGGLALVEGDAPVDALVGALLLLHRPRSHEAQGPPLKLVGVVGRELARALQVDRLADDFVFVLHGLAESVE